MAAPKQNTAQIFSNLLEDVRKGAFKPVYLLMGDEPYYPELLCKAIIDNCIAPECKDFNETICYGLDVTAEQVIGAARQFPMMSDRLLVVVKEAQLMKTLDQLSVYCENPSESTVLVILMHKASADKRKALYKSAVKHGAVLDSPELRDYEMPAWVSSYYKSRGLNISPEAAALMAESVGTDLSRVAAETDKLTRNLPESCINVDVADIEKNVGISRQYSIFELNKEISFRNCAKALKMASLIGDAAKFAMPMAVSAIYSQFERILRYGTLLSKGGNPSSEAKAAALPGVNPYFWREYDAAVRNYPPRKAMAVISLLCEYDYLGKGGDGGTQAPGQLLVELTAKILNI